MTEACVWRCEPCGAELADAKLADAKLGALMKVSSDLTLVIRKPASPKPAPHGYGRISPLTGSLSAIPHDQELRVIVHVGQ